MAKMSNLPSRKWLLDDYPLERELAVELGDIHQRTLSRARKEGKARFFYWGGMVRIHRGDVQEYMKSRIQRRNPPRRARRPARNQAPA
jgi:hypothetical protein